MTTNPLSATRTLDAHGSASERDAAGRPARPVPATRLLSLDALRGFDMLWIIGAGELIEALAKATHWRGVQWFADQQEHVEWAGFHFEDLIFPLFMFISGATIPFALLARRDAGAARGQLYFRALRRGIILVLLGLVYNGIFKLRLDHFQDSIHHFRYASVLGQIGLAYTIAALIALNTRTWRGRLAGMIAVLALVAVAQLLLPLPGHGAGVLTPEGCINGYVDRALLPGRLYRNTFDPEGLTCIVSASALVLMGCLAGDLLRDPQAGAGRKIALLAGAGVVLITAALALDHWYPIIKSAWTGTFNLLTGGISCLLLATFYLVLDVARWRRWALVFVVIGMNSITIYLGREIVGFGDVSRFFLSGVMRVSGSWGQVIFCLGLLASQWLFLWFLYRKKTFLRV